MAKATPPRTGTCNQCGDTFQAGLRGAIASKCKPCREPKTRYGCKACGKRIEPARRRDGSHGTVAHYCSEECKPRCPIDGCERPVRKRGWCTNHYATWLAHGDPEHEVAYTWASERRCVVCGLGPESPEWEGRFRKYCSLRCAAGYLKRGDLRFVPCGQCGADIDLQATSSLTRKRRRSDTRMCDSCARHGRPPMSAQELAEADGAWCRLCGLPVDLAVRSPGRWSASVDHITPRALGGGDELANLQLAHRGCNSSKRHLFVG